jgi:hypothetical protein
MKSIIENAFEVFIGHKTLLYGETDTKKTYYTSQFVKFLLEKQKVKPMKITILDFAPELQRINNLKIGGKIRDYYNKSVECIYIPMSGNIIPPRLKAESEKELLNFAQKNYEKTCSALKNFIENPTEILIMNDISIHLHIGDPDDILETIEPSETFFGNSYYGSSISKDFSKAFSLREKKNVEILIDKINKSYHTNDFS